MKKAAAEKGPESPYFLARQEWNERYGSHIAAAFHWRMTAIGALAVAALCGGGWWYTVSQQRIVPYVVQTNGHGEVTRVSPAAVATAPTANQLRAALRNWVIGARTIYVDGRAQQAILDQTYALTVPDSAAYNTLVGFHKAENPFQKAQRETVEVAVNTVMPLTDATWRIEWTETTRQRTGKVVDTKDWQATVTVVVSAPTTERQIMVNPLGIYVQQFAWATRL